MVIECRSPYMVKPQCQYTQWNMRQRKPAHTPTFTHTLRHTDTLTCTHTHTDMHTHTHTDMHAHTDMHTHTHTLTYTHTLTCTHTHTLTCTHTHTHIFYPTVNVFISPGFAWGWGAAWTPAFSIFLFSGVALRTKTDQSSWIKAPLIKYLPRIGVSYLRQVSGRSLFLE